MMVTRRMTVNSVLWDGIKTSSVGLTARIAPHVHSFEYIRRTHTRAGSRREVLIVVARFVAIHSRVSTGWLAPERRGQDELQGVRRANVPAQPREGMVHQLPGGMEDDPRRHRRGRRQPAHVSPRHFK